MYLFLARVATQMLVILTVTLLGLGFPYTPTQAGLTLFTVGVLTFSLTLWARPTPTRKDLLISLARFVIPVGLVTAGFATAVYTILYQLVSTGLASAGSQSAEGIALFERSTGLTYGVDADFLTASATLGAQSGLSVFVSVTAFALILLLEPPARLFTAWVPVTDDRRPVLLAAGLFVAFALVLAFPVTQAYFGLTAPDPPVIWVAAPAVVLWFGTLSLVLRFQVLERTLGLLRPDPEIVPA
jgi:cation-transporting ATPase E